MKNGRFVRRRAFTLIELMVTIFTALIVIFGIAVYIVDMQRGYGKMYGRVHGELVRDAYVARKAFDGMARQATRFYTVGTLGDTVELDYWQEYTGQLPLDCHAKFSVDAQSQLILESGPVGNLSTKILAHNVSYCAFYRTGNSVQMILELDDENDNRNPVRIVSSAIQHN